ncbi:hypothetical protein ENUP19_0284G0052 [Entamoeba nuttalli]|uniref:Uncharacterized protein n=1 Tax=Entamoeba nuttalli TaxID=412467 RepID=A0ABQ0DTZ4_9EUKA
MKMQILIVLLVILCVRGNDINEILKSHYSVIKSYVKNEIENEREVIKNIQKVIEDKQKLNVTGIAKVIRDDEMNLLELQLTHEKNIKTMFKQSKADIKECLKEDLKNSMNLEFKKIIEKELLRQTHRDTMYQQKINDIEGENQQHKRIEMCASIIGKEIDFMKGTVSGCHNKTCYSIKDQCERRKELLQKTYKKFVKETIKTLEKLIEEMTQLKEGYVDTLPKSNDKEGIILRKRITEIDKIIKGYEHQIVGIKSIHMKILDQIKEEEEHKRRIFLNKFLTSTDDVEKSKEVLNRKQVELQGLENILGARHVFVENRYKLIQRKKHLKKLIKQLMNMRKNVLIPRFIRSITRYEHIQQQLLNEISRKIAKCYRNLQSLDRARKRRENEIKTLKEDIKYDTTLKSKNTLEQKYKEAEIDKKQRIKIVKKLNSIEIMKKDILLALGTKKREFMMKKINGKLESIRSKLVDAKNRGIEARIKIESLKPLEPTSCRIRTMKNYQAMLKRAQEDQIRLIKERNQIVSINKKIVKDQEHFFILILKNLKKELKRAESQRDKLAKETLYSLDNTDKAAKLELLENTIESLDLAIRKSENRLRRLRKLIGHLKETKKSIYCKKNWRCNTCLHLGELAQIGVVEHRGDGWTMNKAKEYCQKFKGQKKEMCFKEAFDMFTSVAHTFDPLKFDAKAVCKRFNHC